MSASRSTTLALVVLAGCNQLLGIKDTDPAPPAFYDGGIDAARGCPAQGAQPDGYSPFVHQAYVQDCQQFSSVPAGRGVAVCFDPMMTVHEGVAGQPLPLAPGITLPMYAQLGTPRLSPDGQRMLVPYSTSMASVVLAMYVRQPDDSWVQGPDPGFGSLAMLPLISTIGHAPTGDRVLVIGDDVTEWEFDGTSTWHRLQVQIPAMFGPFPVDASMTSDALRLMLSDGQTVTYTDRAETTQVFRPAVPLSGVPALTDLFMTDDCARIYMSGFGALYYVQQL